MFVKTGVVKIGAVKTGVGLKIWEVDIFLDFYYPMFLILNYLQFF
jgi:hypothetical protein